jgi:uncharacterized protein
VAVGAEEFDLFIRQSRSLKDKRAVLRSLLDGARKRFQVAAAEVGHQGSHQRATVGFAVVSGEVGHALEVLDAVSRFVWSFPEVEVLVSRRSWAEPD